ncbi:MAG: tetratricopeptide repeat protein [Candidatus Rokubacteria bacterium]|nr:tetratricopeptide repeat protein [Candidatus Rokubacteria bacterium]
MEWDDYVNLVENPHYRGLGWTHLRWIFTTVLMGQWIPLAWVTFGADYLVWGMNPFGYHLTNVLLHAANAAVLYLVALRLLGLATTGAGEPALRLGAAAAALFFALHPLRAESVAWVTERRDVLSGLFFLLVILTFLKASEAEGTRRRRLLAGSVVCYALAVMSKPMVVTLPLVLILLDIYPLRRLGGRWRDWTGREARGVWMEKLPYFLLALAGGAMAFYAMIANSFLTSLEKLPLSARPSVALHSLWFYVWKTFVPLWLSPLYELPPQVNPLDPPFVTSAVAVAILTAGFWLLRRRWPAGLAVWVSYAVILAPVSGLLHNGHQLANDRYSYLPCLGWALLVGASVCAVVRARESGRLRPSMARLAAGGGVVWVLGLGILAWHHVQVWRDTDTLWRYALESNPNCAICLGNLGVSLVNRGIPQPAIEYFQRELAVRPDRVNVYGNLALALLNSGRMPEALWHFQQALERRPADSQVLNNLSVALIRLGKPQEAIAHLKQAMEVTPANPMVRTNLGVALTDLGHPDQAIPHFLKAIELKPLAPLPRFGLARAYLALGRTELALEQYKALKKLDRALATQLSTLNIP